MESLGRAVGLDGVRLGLSWDGGWGWVEMILYVFFFFCSRLDGLLMMLFRTLITLQGHLASLLVDLGRLEGRLLVLLEVG